jgi:hypothetical protein
MVGLPPIPRPAVDMPEVRSLCERLVPGGIPEVLKVDAPPWAEPQDCFGNVTSVIELHGGSAGYGWRLWETLPGLMVEAEFHAIWRDDGGRQHEVTPSMIPGVKTVVFLADTSLVYEGRQIDNVRVSLVDDPLIGEFIQASEDFFEITNRDGLADYHGELVLTPEMRAIFDRRMHLECAIAEKHFGFSAK